MLEVSYILWLIALFTSGAGIFFPGKIGNGLTAISLVILAGGIVFFILNFSQ